MVCWGIWFKCNAVCLKQVSLPYSQIYSDSVARLHEFTWLLTPWLNQLFFLAPNHSDGICFSHFSHLVDDSCIAVSKFRTCFFSHVRRDCNRVAAKLAKNSKFLFAPLVCVEDISENVSPFVSHDRLHLLI